MEEQKKTPEKELNEMEISNLCRCRVQNTGYQDGPGTHWVLQQYKDPDRNEGHIEWIKKNLQGANSGGDEAKNQVNDLEHNEEKIIQSKQQENEF